ncbi:MAG: YbaB/EbfC family nucleoid-associated protein [Patescibacteria group bacterium]|jgi:DNA-binding protein YbaB|nr:YbaB/EbfC family nucleoid-associated protein [Patescibacteria group bacterium]
MFNKLKQFKDLRSQAKTMQNALSQESVTEEKNGVKITLNGNMEIVDLQLNPELSIDEQTRNVKTCFNDALKKVQRLMAKKMQEMGGIPGLS